MQTQNAIAWFEISVTEMSGVSRFYTQALTHGFTGSQSTCCVLTHH